MILLHRTSLFFLKENNNIKSINSPMAGITKNAIHGPSLV